MSDVMRAVLGKMAEKVGLKSSDAKQMATLEQKLRSAKATNINQLEALKDEIRALETRAIKKKEEYDKSRGEVKSILAGEIEQTFRDMYRRKERRKIIERNIDQISSVQAKIEEIRAAQAQGASENEVDDIALRAEASFEELAVGDRARKDLEKERYEGPQPERIDIEERASRLKSPSKDKGELSKDVQKRLKELEPEGE